ncbi:MAG: hypothetical protein PHR00_00590 [Patescibacteria group bacterium]|nr:hypothetical protein [Patescibacteria group bacterium]
MIIRIILGIVFIAIGIFLNVKTESMLQSFGRMAWFEMKLGVEGGSRLGYRLIGIILIFLGVLIAFGMIDGFIMWILSPLLNYGAPSAAITP